MPNLDVHVADIIDTSQPSVDDEDALISALEDDNSTALLAFREQRIQQLHEEFSRAKARISDGYGTYTEIKNEKELMDLTTNSTYIVVHFSKDDFMRCRSMDVHLNLLADKHYDTRFVKISVNNAPFLVEKMGIRVLPCVICWIDAKSVGRIVGFEGLGFMSDNFTTKDLEARLLSVGVIQRVKFVNVCGNGQSAHISNYETEEDV